VITLYDYAASPNCVRVRLALAFAGLRYRKVRMSLEGDQKRPAFRALSPLGTVPVLVDGRTAVPESYAALLWIAGKRPALLPRAGASRARVLFWLAASATEVDPAVSRAYAEAYFTRPRDDRRVAAAVRTIVGVLDRIERARASGGARRYVAASSPTVADAAIFPALWLLRDLAAEAPRVLRFDRWPSWNAWYETMIARPDVAGVLADADADAHSL
jgi:glutathione S-transferase